MKRADLPGRFARSAAAIVGLASLLSGAACNSSSTFISRTGVASPSQESVGSLALSLRYREVAAIRVLRRDVAGVPEPGVSVVFTIRGDSGGSALGSGHATSGSDGVASVALAAGIESATFRVVATSPGAEDLTFDVTVSRSSFVDLAVRLSYPGRGMAQVTSVRAMVYSDRGCSALPASKMEPANYARMNYVPSASSTLEFLDLPALNYALVGRAEDAEGHVIARGCVDLLDSQLTGGRIEVPVPMTSVVPVLADAYLIESTLDLSSLLASPASPIRAWDRLGACPLGLAQALLDAVVDSLDPGPLQAGLIAARAAADQAGCRPEVVAGVPTLDAQLYQMMWAQNGAEAQLPHITAELHAIVRETRITSRLALTSREEHRYLGSHALTRVSFQAAALKPIAAYDPGAFGLPVISVDSIPVVFDGQNVAMGAHGVTLRLPWLWGHALVDLVLTPRGLPVDIRKLLASAVATATRPGANGQPHLMGCDAIEGLLCKAAALNGPCTLASACELGVDALVAALSAPFTPAPGIDFLISGHATAVDATGDLVVEALERGELDAVVSLAPMSEVKVPATFAGTAVQIP